MVIASSTLQVGFCRGAEQTSPGYADEMTAWRLLAAMLLLAAACTSEPQPPPNTQAGTAPSTTSPAGPTTAPSTTTPETSPAPDDRAEERVRIVDEQIVGRGVSDPVVLEAMRAVPRHRVVTEEWQDQAYADHPLPIGHGQTISQPFIVALMSEALGVEPGAKVLEIGTGSGYHPRPRGNTTFTSIEDFPFDRYSKRGRVRAVAEVSVDYAIPDVAGLTTGLWRAEQDRWVPADPSA